VLERKVSPRKATGGVGSYVASVPTPRPVLCCNSSMRFDASALVRCSSKGSPASFGKPLEIGALRASHGFFAGGPLVGVLEHVALWGLFLGLLIGHGIYLLSGQRTNTSPKGDPGID